MGLQLEYYSGIDIGLRRTNNQDSLFINEKLNIFSVADGLGGHLGGEVASSMALSLMNESMMESMNSSIRNKTPSIIKKAFKKANQDIFNQGQMYTSLKGMGTTLVMTWVQDKQIFIGNVGDSRVYLYRNSQLWQLTDDHAIFTEASKKGFDTQENIAASRNLLTNSVGFRENLQVDIFTRDTIAGDIYLLCSDGLHGMVSDQVILDVFQSEELKNIPQKCINKALSSGGYDNVAVIAVKIISC